MNFLEFKLNITRRGSKITHSLVLVLIIFFLLYAFSSSQEKSSEEIILSEGNLTDEQFFGEYTYHHYTGPPYKFDVFQIFQKDKLVYRSPIGYEYWLYKDNDIYSLGDDITGDGIPNLLVQHSSGYKSGGIACLVFSLGPDFRNIQTLPQGDFIDLNRDGIILEYQTYDNTFAYWHASTAHSPYPKLIYQYQEENYQISATFMARPLPTFQEEAQALIQIQKEIAEYETRSLEENCWYYQGTYLSPSVWRYMLDLLYSGHPQEARQFLDKVWPEDKLGKELFLIEFKERLNNSDDWKRIRDELYKITEEKKLWTIGIGQIKITSTPAGASIIFNGERKDDTPLTLSDIPFGKHQLTLDRSGYEDWKEDIFIYSAQLKEVDVKLVARTGDAIVKVWPFPDETKESRVFLDGEYVGQGFLLLEQVSPGEHSLKVTKEGYQNWENTLSFYPGETHIVAVDLEAIVKGEFPLEKGSLKTSIFVLIGLVIFTFIVFYYEGLKKEKNKKGLKDEKSDLPWLRR